MELNEIGKKKYLAKGSCAKCYVLENGNVFKKFNEPLNISEIENFRQLLKYKNDSFLFPFDFVYDDKNFYGYITENALCKPLEKEISNSNLLNLSTHSIKLESDIKRLSKEKIILYDLNSKNVLYNGQKYIVIDPDDYCISQVYGSEFIEERNFKYYRIMFTNLFVKKILVNKNTRFMLDKINEYKYSNMLVSEIIIKIKEEIDKEFKSDINTIDELKEIFKR